MEKLSPAELRERVVKLRDIAGNGRSLKDALKAENEEKKAAKKSAKKTTSTKAPTRNASAILGDIMNRVKKD